MIRNEIKKNILSFEPYNERLCKLRIKGRFNTPSTISAHPSTEEKTDEEKEKFYEDLQTIHNRIPKHDIVIILGDMNSKIGEEDVYETLQVNIHSMISQIGMVSGSVSTQLQTT